jgi:SOS-response transcriptional repressor LexA
LPLKPKVVIMSISILSKVKVVQLKEHFVKARLKAGLSQVQLAEKVGVSQAAINKIETGATLRPRRLHDFAKHLKVTEEWLQYGVGDGLELVNTHEAISPSKMIPLISWVQAGAWSETVDNYQPGDADEHYPCPEKHSSSTFALTIVGESMYPDFIPGEIIYVDPCVEAASGSCVVIRQNGDTEATFKQLMLDGSKKYLKALNPNWPSPIIEMLPDAVICGVVIGSYRKRN